jgi:hypothetical protein
MAMIALPIGFFQYPSIADGAGCAALNAIRAAV